MSKKRIVKDSMGEMEVSDGASYGAQTQRAIENFPVSGLTMPRAFLSALGMIKQACAKANHKLDALDGERYQAISEVCKQMIDGKLESQFPVDVFQTGSGTSTNMNANEVIATIASRQSGI